MYLLYRVMKGSKSQTTQGIDYVGEFVDLEGVDTSGTAYAKHWLTNDRKRIAQ
jgi:hypothetical protein